MHTHPWTASLAAAALASTLGLAGCPPGPNSCQTVLDCHDAVGPCQRSECSNESCIVVNRDEGVPCDTGQVCDSQGDCVASCGDEKKDGDETDVDCGGSCAGCAEEQICNWDGDCESGVCVGSSAPRRCKAASCHDSQKNGDETDVDCGGGCEACGPGKGCSAAGDCATGSCVQGHCCAVPCDGLCHACDAEAGACLLVPAGQDPGEKCPGATNTCDGAGHCELCTNQKQDSANHETGADCGGDICPRCPVEEGCVTGSDCASCHCDASTHRCVAALCDDGEQDGCETDLDCGGPCGATCTYGQTCLVKADCLSGSCVDNHCGEP